ncbi:MAG: hypothetical protein EOL87_13835 [Spartobacteria bacterium]|nr:hypothetical protein [Spartobacteria bacterium]
MGEYTLGCVKLLRLLADKNSGSVYPQFWFECAEKLVHHFRDWGYLMDAWNEFDDIDQARRCFDRMVDT